MRACALLLPCLACMSDARTEQTSRERSENRLPFTPANSASLNEVTGSRSFWQVSSKGLLNQMQKLTVFLVALQRGAAFNPSGLRSCFSVGHPISARSFPALLGALNRHRRQVPLMSAVPRSKAEPREFEGLSKEDMSPEEPFKINLYALQDEELTALLTSWGQPKFRAKQIKGFIYDQGVSAVDQMHNLPKALRALLCEHTSLGSMSVAHELHSADGTCKRLWKCHDDSLIESVLMPYDDNRRTACISSQVGCAMGCTFCATGQMGFKRDLTETEIFEQAARFSNELKAKDERLSNIVFMGMGEPFRNYDAVLGAARRIMRDLGIGARHLTISTSGLVPEIRRFAEDCAETGLEVKLAISLHQSNDDERSAIMPVNRKYDLNQLLDACRYYVEKTGRRISFEWALIAGRNDDAESASRLADLLRGIKCHVNLIPLNPTRGFDGKPTALPNAGKFVEVLDKRGIPATVRLRRGIDIDAGCGQLADSASKEKIEKRKARREAEPLAEPIKEADANRAKRRSLRVRRGSGLHATSSTESDRNDSTHGVGSRIHRPSLHGRRAHAQPESPQIPELRSPVKR